MKPIGVSSIGCLVAVFLAWFTPEASAVRSEPSSLTVRDVVNLRTPTDIWEGTSRPEVSLSPTRHSYVVVLRRGDIKSNGNWLEFYSGTTLNPTRPKRVATLFTRSISDFVATGEDPISQTTPIRWLDDHRLCFVWTDGTYPSQIFMLNVSSGALTRVTNSASPVMGFSISGNNQRVLFDTIATERATDLRNQSFIVPNTNYGLLLSGYFGGLHPLFTMNVYSKGLFRGDAMAIRSNDHRLITTDFGFAPVLCRSGAQAIMNSSPVSIPTAKSWLRFPSVELRYSLRSAITVSLTAGDGATIPFAHLTLIDSHFHARSLIDAPSPNASVVWSEDCSHVLVGPTFLPGRTSARGTIGSAVVDIDTATGEIAELPLTSSDQVRPLAWRSGVATLSSGSRQITFKSIDGHWYQIDRANQESDIALNTRQRYLISWVDDLNSPPRLFALDRKSGRPTLLLDPEPRLAHRFLLGHVAPISWTDQTGRVWTGRLYYPVHYVPGRRYPLVIQAHGVVSDALTNPHFSLLGGTYTTSAVAAQPLANKDIMVLVPYEARQAVMTPRYSTVPRFTSASASIAPSAYLSGIKFLSNSGLIDQTKVGIVGHSLASWWVLQSLVDHGPAFAAAIAADGQEESYVQSVLNLQQTNVRVISEIMGAAPFGAGLQNWFKRAVGFNIDKVCTPLRLEIDGGTIPWAVNYWETFSRLRLLERPVELFLVPDSARGQHQVQMPSQQIASEEGVVDWMEYWLKGSGGDDLKKRVQYQRWDKLRELRRLEPASCGG